MANSNSYIKLSPNKLISIVFSGKYAHAPESLLKEHGYKQAIILEQTHSDKIVTVKSSKQLVFSGYDGSITELSSLPLIIKTADCVPIFITNKTGSVIVALHSGLKGTIANIVGKATQILLNKYKLKKSELLYFIGPCIHACCYEVGPEIKNQISTLNISDRILTPNKTGKYMLDLVKFNQQLIKNIGIKASQITTINLCTGCNKDLFYSYRKRKDTERMYSFIVKNEN